MKPRMEVFSLAMIALVAAMFAGAFVASAHTASTWYGPKWGSNHLNPKWRFANDVPTGTWLRDRIKDGAGHWNYQGQPMSFNFEQNQSDYSAFPFMSCPKNADGTPNAEKDAIHWGYLDGPLGTAGQAYVCSFANAGGTDSNSIANFQIRFDSGENWYTNDTGTPSCASTSTCQTDLESVATHEFGHATGRVKGGDGFGHFTSGNDGWICNNNADQHHTMCKSGIANTTYDRTLNTHDKDTFDNAY